MSKKGVRPPAIKFFVYIPKDSDTNSEPIIEAVGEALYTKRRKLKRNQQLKPNIEQCIFPPVLLPEKPFDQPIIPMAAEVYQTSDQPIRMTGEPESVFPNFAEGEEDEFSHYEQDHIGECGIYDDDF